MKLSTNTDFTKLPRAGSVLRVGEAQQEVMPFDIAVLTHDERHLRRRVVELQQGDRVLIDLPQAVSLGHGDRLVLDDGRQVEIISADEDLYDIRARDAVHLAELAWHIGNRHLAAAIEPERILIERDHVIKAMLLGLGAMVTETMEPFAPVRGAYAEQSGHNHGHHGHDQDEHGHDDHAERDNFGRLPGDPHYGHNHG